MESTRHRGVVVPLAAHESLRSHRVWTSPESCRFWLSPVTIIAHSFCAVIKNFVETEVEIKVIKIKKAPIFWFSSWKPNEICALCIISKRYRCYLRICESRIAFAIYFSLFMPMFNYIRDTKVFVNSSRYFVKRTIWLREEGCDTRRSFSRKCFHFTGFRCRRYQR